MLDFQLKWGREDNIIRAVLYTAKVCKHYRAPYCPLCGNNFKAIDIIIIIIGEYTISFMQDIYTYIPETNHVPTEYSVAAILSLLFMVHISLALALALMYFYISTFRSMCAVPNMAVFCSSLILWFPGMVHVLLLLLLLRKIGLKSSVLRIRKLKLEPKNYV
jgi:hypothetical protein